MSNLKLIARLWFVSIVTLAMLAGLFLSAVPLHAASKNSVSISDLPDLVAPVMDFAEMLSPQTTKELNYTLMRLHDSGGSQVVVLTVPDLGGLTIEEAGIRVADQWQVGDQATDRGVILLVAKAERKIRIEVGQGNEGQLPDVVAKRIIEDVMVPLMRSGRTDAAVSSGVRQIIVHVDPSFDPAIRPVTRRGRRAPMGVSALLFLLFFLVALLRLLTRFGGPGSSGVYSGYSGYGHYRGGGSSGWGGFGGGGGFSGGGGGFSGGGSSGGW